MKKKTVIVALLTALMMTASARAVAITSAQDGDWATTTTWGGGVAPVAGDTAQLRGHTVTVNSAAAAKMIYIGYQSTFGNLVINSGASVSNTSYTTIGYALYGGQQTHRSTLTVYGSYTHAYGGAFEVGDARIGTGPGEGHGTLTVDGGTVTAVTGPLMVGQHGTYSDVYYEGTGIVNILNVGYITAESLWVRTNSVVNLTDGLLYIHRGNGTDLAIDAGGSVRFEQGVLSQASDETAAFEALWINGGFTFSGTANDESFTNTLASITYTQDLGDGNTAYVGLDADGNTDTFVAAPEPAAISLIFFAD